MKVSRVLERSPARRAIGVVVIIAALVVLIVAVGGALFYFSFLTSGSASNHTTLVTTTGPHTSSTASLAGFKTYSGTYSYSVPIGPTGERVNSSGKPELYTSVQVATGTFTFFINPQNYSGSGNGQGTLTVTTTGFCSGTTSFHYSFKIYATNILGGNITVAFETPAPAQFMVPLSCTGSLDGVNTATNNPAPFLSVYPNLVSSPTVPVNVNQQLSGGITYQYTITATN